jgi:hypothetical protein
MGAFSQNMQGVGVDLITQFGNDCVLTKKVITDKVYNPVTDEYVGTDASISFNCKCVVSDLEEGSKAKEENPAIKKVATIPYYVDIVDLDASWQLDGNEIYKVDKSLSQNDIILFKVYIG